MKKNSLLHRTVCFAGSAVLLAGLLTGFSLKAPGALAVPASAETYQNSDTCYLVDTESLNVRSGPDIGCRIVLTLPEGTRVQVLETNGKWSRIAQGWVDSSFLRPESYIYQQYGGVTGYVTATALNVRTGPGTGYAICGQVMEGYRLTILEARDGWGRINDGWVSLQYVNRTGSPSKIPSGGGNNDIRVNSTGRVTATNLNVRQGPGINYPKSGSLAYGTPVTILEIKNGWGRINGGWISLAYVRGENGYEHTVYGDTAEITADSLNVRTGPGMNYPSNGMMTKGYRVRIIETRDGWGRVSGGWISLDYIRWVR